MTPSRRAAAVPAPVVAPLSGSTPPGEPVPSPFEPVSSAPPAASPLPRLRAAKVATPAMRHAYLVRFGRLIRAARLRRGFSQGDLADRSRVHRTHISLVEGGARDPQLTTVHALALGLGLNPGELLPTLLPPEPGGR